jgi:E3 ubiquitin-protein ligase FANCL
MYRNLGKWKSTDMLRKNLERILRLTFPSKKTTRLKAFELECTALCERSSIKTLLHVGGICYSYRMDQPQYNGGSMIPDRICDYKACSRPFHEVCLLEWLKSIPTSRKSFQTIFGTINVHDVEAQGMILLYIGLCPYCREPISAKIM